MKVAVFGPSYYRGASYENYDYVSQILDVENAKLSITELHSGGGKGVETMALRWAALNGIEPFVTPPNIKKDGVENAFIIRNSELIDKVDHCILLWDTVDSKYAKMIKQCAGVGKTITIYGIQ